MNGLKCGLLYLFLTWIYLCTMSLIFWKSGRDLMNMDDPHTHYLSQIAQDWTTVPFIDIEVTDAWQCDTAREQTEVFTRPWYGTYMACDCTKTDIYPGSAGNTDHSFTMVQNQQCDTYDTYYGCQNVEP